MKQARFAASAMSALMAFAAMGAQGKCPSAVAGMTLSAGNIEVLVAPKAPDVTMFAAEEMTNFLSQVLGAAVPIVKSPTEGKASVVVGTNAWSAAADVDPSKLNRDGFIIKCDPGAKRVYVAGCDDPKTRLRRESM